MSQDPLSLISLLFKLTGTNMKNQSVFSKSILAALIGSAISLSVFAAPPKLVDADVSTTASHIAHDYVAHTLEVFRQVSGKDARLNVSRSPRGEVHDNGDCLPGELLGRSAVGER